MQEETATALWRKRTTVARTVQLTVQTVLGRLVMMILMMMTTMTNAKMHLQIEQADADQS
jgi:hypothetical protein